MKSIIKIIQGEECTVEVDNDATIVDIKKEVSKRLQVQVQHQRLVLLGKTLIDESSISLYKTIKEGSKIYLVKKAPDTLEEALHKLFRKFYSQQESENYANQVQNTIRRQIAAMSLDDIERLSKYYIDEDAKRQSDT